MTKPAPNRHRRVLLWLIALVIGMFGFGYAMVPLYNVLCKVTGINGKTGGAVAYSDVGKVDKNRVVTLELVATTNAGLAWDFYPLVNKISVHPGANARIVFYAKNNSDHTMTVQAIPSVAPGFAAKYLKKTECFCFTRQTFNAGEARDMPVLFHVDPNLPKDVNTLTLSYTMFDVAQIKHPPPRAVGRIS